jgi:hypothetical protein
MKSLNNRAIQSRTATAVRLCPPAAVVPRYKPTHVSPCTQPQFFHAISLGLSRQQQQQHMQQLQQQRWSPLQPAQAASSDSSSSNSDGSASNSSSGSQPQQKLNWFDRLSQNTQLMIMGGLLFVALVSIGSGTNSNRHPQFSLHCVQSSNCECLHGCDVLLWLSSEGIFGTMTGCFRCCIAQLCHMLPSAPQTKVRGVHEVMKAYERQATPPSCQAGVFLQLQTGSCSNQVSCGCHSNPVMCSTCC